MKEELEYQAAWTFFENICGEKLDDEVRRIRQSEAEAKVQARQRQITAGLAGAGRAAHAA